MKSPQTDGNLLKYDFSKSLIRNFGERAQGPLHRWPNPFNTYWSKSITFDYAEYCLGLTNRRKLPDDEIHILFPHYHYSPETSSFSSFIAFICSPVGEKVKMRNLRCMNFSQVIIFDMVQSITVKRSKTLMTNTWAMTNLSIK